MEDIRRQASFLGLDIKCPPSVFPANTITAQRLLIAIKVCFKILHTRLIHSDSTLSFQNDSPDKLCAVSRALWKKYWCLDQDVSSHSVLLQTLVECGFSSEEVRVLLCYVGSLIRFKKKPRPRASWRPAQTAASRRS